MSTPRTDAAAKEVRSTENGILVRADFARELERENAALKIECNRYRVALQDIASSSTGWARERAKMQLRKEAKP